ncbi:MAG TPA: regulatory iron-sulfur-containing complex subunit RicT [Gemmataceae bacterium]|jgi:cell fate regulator YaaT (PSP1 superfamily)|nr:regulatory iron-sulfur-containing complex subunit RicT [Gemmataceae bacterium]
MTADVAEQPKTYIVRHGAMRLLGEFGAPPDLTFARGDRVVAKTDRGQELGDVLCPATPQAVARLPDPTRGDIVRLMTGTDRQKEEQIKQAAKKQFETGRRLVTDHRLAMELVDIEVLFGGERLVFYFLADKRVDFRELVRAMAREFSTRIELRQIGVRDEAKLLADYGDCGKPVCCNTHMTVMPPVSMRMAKIQKSTLDPSKISGRCGRLKCCLRFEQDVYDEFLQELPNVGTRVLTAKGQGRVLAQEILARRVLVEFEDGRRLPVPVAEILTKL